MRRRLFRRLLFLGPVWLVVSFIVFFAITLVPGDPALAMLGPYATPERLTALRVELGLDLPLLERYLRWLWRVLHGELGESILLRRPVALEVWERLGPTLLLAGLALAASVALGLIAGMAAAMWRNRWFDRLITVTLLVGVSVPSFWLGLMLIWFFSIHLGWLPVSGVTAAYGGGDLLDRLRHLILPTATLALISGGIIARLVRTAALESLSQDYVRLLRAKGISEWRLISVHLSRHVLVAVLPVIGLQAGFLLGGAVYVETIFQWPGLGRLLVDAIAARDLPLVQGGVLVLATFYVLFNLVADLLGYGLDPRGDVP